MMRLPAFDKTTSPVHVLQYILHELVVLVSLSPICMKGSCSFFYLYSYDGFPLCLKFITFVSF